MRSLSVVVPALNEVHNIKHVLDSVPHEELSRRGWTTEVVVVDNASTDGTGDVARQLGARVVYQPQRGYGNAYRAGFSHATGEVIATGDADRTYPLDHLPRLLEHFLEQSYDFMSTNRLLRANRTAMKPSHSVGNHVLSQVSRSLFGHDYADSQSGMWIFRREIWQELDVRSPGMGFSQELKNEAYVRGFACGEVPIDYRPREGEVKLNAVRDGVGNLRQLFAHRHRNTKVSTVPAIPAQRRGQPVAPATAPQVEATGQPAVEAVGMPAALGERTFSIPSQRERVRLEANAREEALSPRSSVDAPS